MSTSTTHVQAADVRQVRSCCLVPDAERAHDVGRSARPGVLLRRNANGRLTAGAGREEVQREGPRPALDPLEPVHVNAGRGPRSIWHASTKRAISGRSNSRWQDLVSERDPTAECGGHVQPVGVADDHCNPSPRSQRPARRSPLAARPTAARCPAVREPRAAPTPPDPSRGGGGGAPTARAALVRRHAGVRSHRSPRTGRPHPVRWAGRAANAAPGSPERPWSPQRGRTGRAHRAAAPGS